VPIKLLVLTRTVQRLSHSAAYNILAVVTLSHNVGHTSSCFTMYFVLLRLHMQIVSLTTTVLTCVLSELSGTAK
jgi:hypothetical protein